MKRRFYSIMLRSLMGAAMVATCSDAVAEGWEQIRELPNAYTHFITSTGRFLMSDLDLSRKGGYHIPTIKVQPGPSAKSRTTTIRTFMKLTGIFMHLAAWRHV